MRYWTKPHAVEVVKWESLDTPPSGVHDVWVPPGKLPVGYLRTPKGDKIVQIGDLIATFLEDGAQWRVTEEDLRENFVKDE